LRQTHTVNVRLAVRFCESKRLSFLLLSLPALLASLDALGGREFVIPVVVPLLQWGQKRARRRIRRPGMRWRNPMSMCGTTTAVVGRCSANQRGWPAQGRGRVPTRRRFGAMARLELTALTKRLLARSFKLLEMRLSLRSQSFLFAESRALGWREGAALRRVAHRPHPREPSGALMWVLWRACGAHRVVIDVIVVAIAVVVSAWKLWQRSKRARHRRVGRPPWRRLDTVQNASVDKHLVTRTRQLSLPRLVLLLPLCCFAKPSALHRCQLFFGPSPAVRRIGRDGGPYRHGGAVVAAAAGGTTSTSTTTTTTTTSISSPQLQLAVTICGTAVVERLLVFVLLLLLPLLPQHRHVGRCRVPSAPRRGARMVRRRPMSLRVGSDGA
jgi:hypothetical protein